MGSSVASAGLLFLAFFSVSAFHTLPRARTRPLLRLRAWMGDPDDVCSVGSDTTVALGGFAKGAELIRIQEEAEQHEELMFQELAAGRIEKAGSIRSQLEGIYRKDPRRQLQQLHEQLQCAERVGDTQEAVGVRDKIRLVQGHLPEFQLEGLWVARTGPLKKQLIQVTYQGDMLFASTVYTEDIAPVSEPLFHVDLAPGIERPEAITVEEVSDPRLRRLERFHAEGRVESEFPMDGDSWVPGQLIVVGGHFAFAWIPSDTQVFFMRVPNHISEQIDTLERNRRMLNRMVKGEKSSNDEEEESS